MQTGGLPSRVTLPRSEPGPLGGLARRVALAVALVAFVTLVAYVDRGGYRDTDGTDVSLLDAVYYATVSITTTGYGDIAPVTDRARLLTTVLVTPARILFLVLLVGTTLELLAERTRTAYRLRQWRKSLRDHVIICGFGTKGRSAAATVIAGGTRPDSVVVIDDDRGALEEARLQGFATVAGTAERAGVLEDARVRDARGVVIAPDRDDAAVLITLTARELNPNATIIAAAREEENAHLLAQSGATTVITSSSAAGRLLGLAVESPQVVGVLEDLLSVGEGLDLVEREAVPEEVGRPVQARPGELTLAVVRDSVVLRFGDPRIGDLRPGDRLVCLSNLDRSRA